VSALTGLRKFRVAVDRSDDSLTSFGGLPLALQAFSILGLDRAAKAELQLKERQRGPTEAQWAAVATMVHVAGAESPAELDRLKEESGLVRVWPVLDQVSSRSLRDYLARFDDPNASPSVQGSATIPPETPALEGLGRVRDHLVAEVQRRRPSSTATIEVDASIIESWKRAALYHYDDGRGYQPLFAYWGEQRLILRDQFRDGNVPAGFDLLPFVEAAFAALPSGVVHRYFRSDSAAYDHALLRWLDREKIGFAVSADVGESLREECRRVPRESWQPLRRRDGTPCDKEIAEVPYVPEDRASRPGELPFRYIGIRIPARDRQLDIFEPAQDGYRYFAIVTNRSESPQELVLWQRERCGSVEVAIDGVKNDTGAGVMTSQKFGANAAWLRFGVIAFNLFEAMKILFPGPLASAHAFSRPQTLRRQLVQVAARLIRHANRLVLVVAGGGAMLLQAYAQLQHTMSG
jgi:hypothetical protein